MVAVLIYYFLISFTCLWAGFLLQALFVDSRDSKTEEVFNKHLIIYAFWGLIFITLFAQIVELFVPVNQYTWLAFLLFLGLLSVLNKHLFASFCARLKNIRKQSPAVFLICFLLVIFISVLNAGPTLMDDTESYHIQMIKWIQEYGSVLGLTNLHARYGFNSSWFAFASLFIPLHTQYNFFSIANGVLSVWLSVYFFTYFRNGSKSRISTTDTTTSISCFLIFLVTIFSWPMLRGNATNANYDFVTTCMIIILFIELWQQRNDDGQWKDFLPELFIWPVFIFTVRIINFPLLLLSLFAFVAFIKQRNSRLLITCSVISLALALPFLARNIMLSGYIFYPIYQIDIFRVDWKANPNIAKDILFYIKYFNRVNTGFKPIHETQNLGFPEWIPVWFYYLFNYDKLVLVFGIAGYLLILTRLKLSRLPSLPIKLFICTLVIQLISWFLIAPDPRFAYGALLTGIFLIPFLLPNYLTGSIHALRKFISPLSTILFVGLFVYIVSKIYKDPRYSNPVIPARLPIPATRLIKIDNIEYRIPEKIPGNWNARCYATDLPCLYEIQPGLTVRGKTIREGFKLKK